LIDDIIYNDGIEEENNWKKEREKKRQRLCSNCRLPGHNAKTCKKMCDSGISRRKVQKRVKNKDNRGKSIRQRLCSNCKLSGHYSKTCKKVCNIKDGLNDVQNDFG